MLRIYYKLQGGHYHCRVFGPGSSGKAGDLTFREEEWNRVQDLLSKAAEFIEDVPSERRGLETLEELLRRAD